MPITLLPLKDLAPQPPALRNASLRLVHKRHTVAEVALLAFLATDFLKKLQIALLLNVRTLRLWPTNLREDLRRGLHHQVPPQHDVLRAVTTHQVERRDPRRHRCRRKTLIAGAPSTNGAPGAPPLALECLGLCHLDNGAGLTGHGLNHHTRSRTAQTNETTPRLDRTWSVIKAANLLDPHPCPQADTGRAHNLLNNTHRPRMEVLGVRKMQYIEINL